MTSEFEKALAAQREAVALPALAEVLETLDRLHDDHMRAGNYSGEGCYHTDQEAREIPAEYAAVRAAIDAIVNARVDAVIATREKKRMNTTLNRILAHGPCGLEPGSDHGWQKLLTGLDKTEADKSIKLVGVGIDGEECKMYSRRALVNSSDGSLERTLLDIARSVYE